jgi:DNA-binding PadR family transcriptional regulator
VPLKPLSEDLQILLPLSSSSFFVLFALANGEKHGYRIMQEIDTLSNGNVRMGPATLYTTIQKFVDQSLIEEVRAKLQDRRRTYRLTRLGKHLLQAEFSRQNDVLNLARARNLFTSERNA